MYRQHAIGRLGLATEYPSIDWETRSEAGAIWDPDMQKWCPPPGASKRGLPVIGMAVYAMHPTTDILMLRWYTGSGVPGLWLPGQPLPTELFAYLASGGIVEAVNAGFEWYIWNLVATRRYGFPPLPATSLRCAAAKARAFGLPGSLDGMSQVLSSVYPDIIQKDKKGQSWINKYSVPRNPTAKNRKLWNDLADNLKDYQIGVDYCGTDCLSEHSNSVHIPDLPKRSLRVWQADQTINRRGVYTDQARIADAINIIEQAYAKYNRLLDKLTCGAVKSASEVSKLLAWMKQFGIEHSDSFDGTSLDEDALDDLLARKTLPPQVRGALMVRALIGSAAVKKLYAMQRYACPDGRIREMIVFHTARTGRFGGSGPQPHNFPNSGPAIKPCGPCGRTVGAMHTTCPLCGSALPDGDGDEWDMPAVEDAIQLIAHRNLDLLEKVYGTALAVISGCLRGFFCAAPGKVLIVSDYSAIEAVVLAALAGEEWRLEVFRTHGKIYEMSASKIANITFDDIIRHKKDTGKHHPLRKKLGKVAELASGYGGWVNAWVQFGADEFYDEEEIKKNILRWREESPMIVEYWGGQVRGAPWSDRRKPEYFGVEGMFIAAIQWPGETFEYRGTRFTYHTDIDVLQCILPSGRPMYYHRPRLEEGKRWGLLGISYEGYNTNPKNGAKGWIRMYTHGGKLTENIVQAVAADLLWDAILRLEAAGYPVVMHIHDEIVVEVPEGFGSIEEVEKIMAERPQWAADWPIKAAGGFRSKRYGK